MHARPNANTRFTARRRLARAAGIAILTGLSGLAVLPMTGCDGPSASAAALDEAASLMSTLSASANTPAARDFARERVYQRIISTLEPVQNQGTESQQAAARLLLAQARIGLADQPFADAGAAQARVLNRVTAAEGALSSYVQLSGHAAALERFDPRDTLADLRDRTSRLEREREQAIRERDALAGEIAALREQADARNTDAQRLRNAVAEVRLRAARQTATEAAEMLAGVRGQTREADRFEMQGADLAAQADLMEPALAELRVGIERIEAQQAALARAGERAQATAQRSTEDARAAREAAQQVARDLSQQIDEFLRLHAEEVDPRIEETVTGLDRAVSLANQAARELRGSARATGAQASQALAHTHATASATLTRVATFLEASANATPPIPNADRYRRTAAELNERARTHRQAARDAEQTANEGFTAAGVRRGADEPALGDTDWSSTGDVGTEDGVRAFLAELQAANDRGDTDFLADAMIAEGPIAERMLDGINLFAQASARLDRATENQFGRPFSVFVTTPEAAESGSVIAGMLAGGGFSDLIANPAGADTDMIEIQVFGDEATLSSPDSPEPIRLRMRNGRWAILLTDEDLGGEGMGAVGDALIEAFPAMANAYNDAAQRVESGQLESEQAVLTALEGQMMGVMMRLMGGGD